MLESIIIWLVIGGLAGWLASLVVRGTGQGIVVNIIVGIIGAVIAGLIFNRGGSLSAPAGGYDVTSFLYAVLGAIILLVILNLVQRGRVR